MIPKALDEAYALLHCDLRVCKKEKFSVGRGEALKKKKKTAAFGSFRLQKILKGPKLLEQ